MLSNPSAAREAKYTDIDILKLDTKYNKIPCKVLRDAQASIGDEIRVLNLKNKDPLCPARMYFNSI